MNTNNKPNPHHKKTALLIISLLFITLLTSSSFVSVFSDVLPFTTGTSSKVMVSTETELRNAVENAVGSVTIALNKDITIASDMGIIMIFPNTDITLTSNKANGYYKLIGQASSYSICVYGVLRLDGIIITRNVDTYGHGVTVFEGGKLIMVDGEISNNNNAFGGGVDVCGGSFEMSGGKIVNNESRWYGGGVCVRDGGSFTMSGGVISNNKVFYYNIFHNNDIHYTDGGGVGIRDAKSSFTMTGGTISGNTAKNGGGVYVGVGSFIMTGGSVTSNTARDGGSGGGVYSYSSSSFSRTGGEISGNTGGDVYIFLDNVGSSDGGNGDGNSSGNNNSSGGNDGSSDGNNGGGSSGGGSGGVSSGDGFSLREVIIICVSAVVVTVGVVGTVLFVYFQKRVDDVEKKLNRHVVDG